MPLRVHGSAIVVLLLASACASGRQPTGDPGMDAPVPDSIFIETLNENFYDARIHAVYGGGTRRSLGTVPGNGGRSAAAIAWEPRELIFEITFLIGGASYVTYPIDVARGESFELRLPANIDGSGFFRRVGTSQ